MADESVEQPATESATNQLQASKKSPATENEPASSSNGMQLRASNKITRHKMKKRETEKVCIEYLISILNLF